MISNVSIRACFALMILTLTSLSVAQETRGDHMILAVGAGGQEEYTKTFAKWTKTWKRAAVAANIELVSEIGTGEEADQDHELLKQSIEKHRDQADSALWLVLIGHGTYDRGIAKFNLRGKDLEATELKDWIANCKRPLVIINAFSCSGAFLKPLQGENRVIITATKSGVELNFSRFGGYLAEAMLAMEADLDHDDQVSLLESFLFATSKVNGFYKNDARLVTEHALLEDNQDGKGISASFFRGIRARAKAKDGSALDGRNAHRFILMAAEKAAKLSSDLAAERDRIEAKIEKLRAQKSKIATDDYYLQLESLMVDMATLYEQK